MRTITVLLAMLAVLSSGCDTLNSLMQYEKPTANLTGVSFGDVSMDAAQLLFDVEINNPYALSLPLLDVDYVLQTGGNPLLSGSADLATTIPAESSKVVTLPVAFNYADLLTAMKSLKDIRPGSQIPYAANVGLGIDSPVLGAMRLPLKKEGTLDVPTVEEMMKIDWQGLIKDSKILDNLD